MSTGPRQVFWLMWRRATWATSTRSKTRLYADRRAAVAAAERLVADGYRVSMSWARCGLFHPDSLELTVSTAAESGCDACSGTGTLLAEIDALARPCPACIGLAS